MFALTRGARRSCSPGAASGRLAGLAPHMLCTSGRRLAAHDKLPTRPLDPGANVCRAAEVTAAKSNSFAFGGNNAIVILGSVGGTPGLPGRRRYPDGTARTLVPGHVERPHEN